MNVEILHANIVKKSFSLVSWRHIVTKVQYGPSFTLNSQIFPTYCE